MNRFVVSRSLVFRFPCFSLNGLKGFSCGKVLGHSLPLGVYVEVLDLQYFLQ